MFLCRLLSGKVFCDIIMIFDKTVLLKTVCRVLPMSQVRQRRFSYFRSTFKGESGGVSAPEIQGYPERLDNGNRMNGDVQLRFCEGLGVLFPRSYYP